MGLLFSRQQPLDEQRQSSSYGTVKTVESSSSWDDAAAPRARRVPKFVYQLSGLLCYYGIGVVYYGASTTQWTPLETLYFTCIAVPTIGYGDIVPTTDADKLFSIFYVCVGLSCVYVAIANFLGDLVEKMEAAAAEQKRKDGVSAAASLPKDDSDIGAAYRVKIGACLGAIAATMMAGGWVMSSMQGWSFISGLYWAFQTTTTVGFGDEATDMSNTAEVLFVSGYAIVSVGIVGASFAGLSTAKEDAKAERKRRALLRRGLDKRMLAVLSHGKAGGVDKGEFVGGMLVAMGLVNYEVVELLCQRFHDLDEDSSGRLDAQDLALAAAGSISSFG